ncbi:tRNA lysidine(34) synthetase TilS [Salinimicrobium sediminilitoris]|uniref:tRNA lysidine(34) synthetase TilS n=1 Tax=Salinimicrobium sediminilitoris TaxID=2876715 RepID=UPI001E55DAA4|nr:tRNA lysidine(34) synthetase TilS [Salinimicrobium sediminilitoris]MCC8358854.1 tRNA lysidine(34) synthetase TilS [Salinimicrobium sediminilitoris]
MLLAFKNHLKEQFPNVFEGKILLAVSGGVDSVVLAHLCREVGLDFSLAHCNFHLRGEESQGDEAFVMELADALEAEVFIEGFETQAYAKEKKISIQMAARDLRYNWFRELQETLQFDYIFTAHHANDNLETVLINFIRGTGLEGLTGIPDVNEFTIRPLLPFTRKHIEDYAHLQKLKWREDSSNDSVKYFRNKVRLEVIPKLLELNPQLLESFSKTRNYLQQSSELIEDYISALFPKIAKQEEYGYSFEISKLQSIPNTKAVMYSLFRSFEFTEWEDVYDLLESQPGKIVYSKTHRLIRDRDKLLLTLLLPTEDKVYEIKENEEVVMLPMGTFHFEAVEDFENSDPRTIFLDRDKIKYPLVVRKWQEGDYFHPFGMKGKKKLSKFFKDEKLSLPQKENCWLLCSNDKIVWVIGHRPDARFAVKDETKQILRLSYTP